jgi:hypothetical protein
MKKVLYGMMAAAISLGLATAPSFAATPRVKGDSQVTHVQSTKKTPAKKTAKKTTKKPQTAKKSAKKSTTRA